MSNVVEFVTFKLKKGVSEQQFLEASDELNVNFLALQKGYISRKLIRTGETWADIVLWETMDDAMNAMTEANKRASAVPCPKYLDYLFSIEEDSCDLKHLNVVKSY
ncbi:MAG: hypothetical protein FWE54_02910 [Methanimicrococcus sp.]|nr:hypothetical protein [Methanimicrococcus sp.]